VPAIRFDLAQFPDKDIANELLVDNGVYPRFDVFTLAMAFVGFSNSIAYFAQLFFGFFDRCSNSAPLALLEFFRDKDKHCSFFTPDDAFSAEDV